MVILPSSARTARTSSVVHFFRYMYLDPCFATFRSVLASRVCCGASLLEGLEPSPHSQGASGTHKQAFLSLALWMGPVVNVLETCVLLKLVGRPAHR